MPNYQFSLTDINQTAANTIVGDGSATSTQVASVSDPDTLLDLGDNWDPAWYHGSPDINVQVSTNVINQTAVNTVLGDGDATSTQVASISDPDTLGSFEDDDGSPDINVQVSTNVINQTAVNTVVDGAAAAAQVAGIGDADGLFALG